MNNRFIVLTLLSFLLSISFAYAYDLSILTDKYTYSVNESIFAIGYVKVNVTAISNVSVAFTVRDAAGSTVSTSTFVTNSTGQFNSTFSLTSSGNYTLLANASGDTVQHFIKVLPYASIFMVLNKPTYTASSPGALTVNVLDLNSRGVSSQVITSSIRSTNGTLISSLAGCTTDSLGRCSINFTAPSDDGTYVIEVNNFENAVSLVVGGFDAFMKISPSLVGKNQNVTVRVTVKNANGNGISASTRQLVVTAPNGTQTTITSMTPVNDSSGNPLTGVYENNLKFSVEGAYSVKATIQPQGSNLTRELIGSFVVASYLIDIFPWAGSSVFTPGETVSLAIRLSNASSNEFMRTTQCGSGNCITSLSSATVYDPSNVAAGYAVSVSEQTSLSLYRMDITVPSTAKSGTYRVAIALNDSFGSGIGAGYFTIQSAKGKMRALDQFPNGVSEETFLPGKQIVLEFSVSNATGAVNITGISSYSIRDIFGNDKTALFGTGVNYSGNNNKSYINLTAPKQGGLYIAKAKLNTLLGSVDAEGWFFVDVLDLEIRPQVVGGGGPGSFTPFGGPGYMFAFRPNDTVQLQVEVKTASEKRGSEGFMGGGLAKGGSAGGGHSVGFGGMFGIGGGTSVQGAQVVVDRIINLNTDEDITSSTTITNCITDSTGRCTLSLKSNVNGQNWTGGFHIVFVNATTSDNQSDDGEGFFEVRRYFVDVQTRAATTKNATSSGFTTFSDWFIGPDDNVNVTIRVIEPGTWQSVSQSGNATIQGAFYTGTIGEFIFPPKLQAGTTATANISNGGASAIISAPSGGWKSGFYILKTLVNVSGTLDTGESFFMIKIYQGFGEPINPTTKQMDFTTRTNENVTIRINVFDVKRNSPAANLTVTLNKILSFEDFPPSEVTYDKSSVTTGKTDANGQVIMTLPPPSGGWPTGDYLVNFDVTNGTVSDTIQGFFQVKNFFVELSSSKWRYATNETIAFNVTISSDPSWMRQMFGGGCPPGDPMCSGGGGPPSTQPSTTAAPTEVFVQYGIGLDLDNDGRKDVNFTLTGFSPNMTVINSSTNVTTPVIAQNFWCMDTTQCQASPVPLGGNITSGFDSVDCGPVGQTYSNATTHNVSGPGFFCVNATDGNIYKVGTQFGNSTGVQIRFLRHTPGSVGGVAPINTSGTQGFSYFNATLKSVKVIRFSFESGDTLLRQGSDYNVTSATESTVGEGKIVIPGTGSFKLKPLGTWSSGFYRVVAEFNISASASDVGESGFSVETFFANCYRPSWGSAAIGDNISIRCDVTDPATNGNYASRVDMSVESVRNTWTFQSVSTGWSANNNFTDSTRNSANITLTQSLGNGQYEATIKLNASSTDVKRQSIWFEIKDFEPYFWSDRWSYSSSDTVSLRAYGLLSNQMVSVNISNSSGSPELVVYKYDKSTWSKSVVTGITINTIGNLSSNGTIVLINLTKSGGWDEGSYEVVANLTRVNAQGVATGGKVEVRTWFEVRLFDVWGWSESWSNHPKSNVTLRVHVGSSGSWWQNYNGIVSANITAITNTQTGDSLTAGTHYSVRNHTANPSSVGDLNLTIVPIGSMPVGSYRATVQVTDSASGRSMTTDIWFDVKAFQFWTYTERYDYASTDNVVFILNVYSPGGTNVTLTGANITYLSKCTSSTCSTVSLSSLNTQFNAATNRLTLLNSSGLTTGWYWAEITVNDTQNATASSGAGFQIKSFGISGNFQYPLDSNNFTRWYYFINETMKLNVTGTVGTNITNATFNYWECTGMCTQKRLLVNIGRVLTRSNELINITPPGLNNTWPTDDWGWAWYNADVNAMKDGDTSTFYASAGVSFPYVWNITVPSDIGPNDNITANITVYVDQYPGTQRLANAIVNVSRVLSYSTWTDVNTTPNAWNHTGNVTDANGSTQVTLRPSNFNWTSGNMYIQYTAKYGNATTQGSYYITVAQKTLNVLGKRITNTTVGTEISNATINVPFNLSVTVDNPNSVAATYTITLTNAALNSSAQVNNMSALTLTGISLGATTATTHSFMLNSTGVTNITSTILITPSTSGFAPASTTHTFTVR